MRWSTSTSATATCLIHDASSSHDVIGQRISVDVVVASTHFECLNKPDGVAYSEPRFLTNAPYLSFDNCKDVVKNPSKILFDCFGLGASSDTY